MEDLSYYKSPSKRVILGHLNTNGNSPISPMANLKLLTKVATSHITMGENINNNLVHEGINDETKSQNVKCSRRLRSLSFICQKFLLSYPLEIAQGQFKVISLVNLASCLGVEKRRVYDIINVVASLRLAERMCKDKYRWFGNQKLLSHLTDLKTYAYKKKLNYEIDNFLKNEEMIGNEHFFEDFEAPRLFSSNKTDKAEDNRIGVLCQKCMIMFLAVDEVALNLCDISRFVLTAEQGKTGMRRLYDVANVLETLGLIRRHGKINKKPTFVYCGPQVSVSETESSNDDSFVKPINSILEIVCTELEKLDDKPKAKRKLYIEDSESEFSSEEPCAIRPLSPNESPSDSLESRPHTQKEENIIPNDNCLIPDDNSQPSTVASFIKAPTKSFRFVCNQITEKPLEKIMNGAAVKKPHLDLEPSAQKVPTKLFTISQIKGSSIIGVPRKAQASIKIIRPMVFNLKPRKTALRIVKCGEAMKLVKVVMGSH